MIKRIIFFVCVSTLICVFAHNLAAQMDPNEVQDPNGVRQIVMPKAIPVPAVCKCPIHGIVSDATLTIEVDEIRKIYCKKCAMTLVCNFFDQNLPKLEVVK
ncbi:MAG: hypothetical protein MUO31_13065 [Thermodesulfovibrionales bacterium]|nr:hypothetical protein [Thermodesulfovibrionales bacterium]